MQNKIKSYYNAVTNCIFNYGTFTTVTKETSGQMRWESLQGIMM